MTFPIMVAFLAGKSPSVALSRFMVNRGTAKEGERTLPAERTPPPMEDFGA